MKINILIVEDEKEIREGVSEYLSEVGYNVISAEDGMQAIELFKNSKIDLVILDIMLPKINGLDVLKQIRNQHIKCPVILLTAKDEISDKVTGLDYGADDYITKPFAIDELLARIRSIQRRMNNNITNENIIKFSDISLDLQTYTLSCNSDSLHLGLKEFCIMEVFINNPNKVISKELLIEKIWGYESDAEYNNVEVYISFLRKKLNHIHSNSFIKTIRGVGYRLED